MHPIVVQREAGNGRAVADMIGLIGIDAADLWQRPLKIAKAASHLAHTRRFQRFRQTRQIIGIEHRIPAAHQNQIAVQHPAAQAAGGHQLRHKPMIATKRVERIKRGQRLGDTGRWQRRLRALCFQPKPRLCIRNRTGDLSAQTCAGQNPLEPTACRDQAGRITCNRAQRYRRRVGQRRAARERGKSGLKKKAA